MLDDKFRKTVPVDEYKVTINSPMLQVSFFLRIPTSLMMRLIPQRGLTIVDSPGLNDLNGGAVLWPYLQTFATVYVVVLRDFLGSETDEVANAFCLFLCLFCADASDSCRSCES
jgi:hypothetical protein